MSGEAPRGRVVGHPHPVHDARLKVTGQLRYVDDMKLPGMLYGKVLRSPRPHARIVSIDTSRAEAAPGVHAVITHRDAPQVRFNANGEDSDVLPSERILDDVVRFVGDKVAAVAAETPEQAEQALKLIDVEYEDLPAYFDPEEAAAPGAYPIHPELRPEGNVLIPVDKSAGDVDAALSMADVVIEGRYEVPAVHHAAIEPHVALASYDASGMLTVWTPTQDVFGQRANLSKALGLPESRVRVLNPAMGGGFGGKIDLVCEPVASLLSMKCGRPVKLVLTRAEDIVSGPTRHAEVIYSRMGFMRDGTMVACDYKVYLSCGAQSGGSMSVAWAAGGKFFKLFRTPNLRYRAYPVYTNRSSAGAMRGFGSPQLFFVMGSQMNEASQRLGIDPCELYLKNVNDPDAVDLLGEPIGNMRAADCIRRGRALFGWDKMREKSEQSRREGGRFRYGCACNVAPHGSSLFGIMPDTCGTMIKMNGDGSITLFTGVSDMGNGSNTTQMLVVSEELGIPLDHISLVKTDTETTLYDVGAFASRGTYVGAGSALACARLVAERVRAEAGELLEVAPEQIELCNDGAQAKGDPGRRVTMQQVAEHAHANERDIVCTKMYGTTAAPISVGAHFCLVRVDASTGKVDVLRYVAVHDVGRPLNPMGLEGQVDGGVQMGIGYALSEGIVLDENGGQPRHNFRDCHLPRATDMPRDIQVEFLDSEEHTGPFGAKSVGECGTVPVAGCVAAAVSNAVGHQFTSLPIRKEDVLCALRESPTQGS
ncbi:MAG: xanthine dehydrogenase family protein molybdopterin-binding subunit [Tractidigestivibacter sp.]|uniref:xanthine dehydrogenase family protein molybdopterin-binding subunit n=1 Tax=Tractidigestivibacter sp. TaxID=2847320 RepID=UPI003D937DB6